MQGRAAVNWGVKRRKRRKAKKSACSGGKENDFKKKEGVAKLPKGRNEGGKFQER